MEVLHLFVWFTAIPLRRSIWFHILKRGLDIPHPTMAAHGTAMSGASRCRSSAKSAEDALDLRWFSSSELWKTLLGGHCQPLVPVSLSSWWLYMAMMFVFARAFALTCAFVLFADFCFLCFVSCCSCCCCCCCCFYYWFNRRSTAMLTPLQGV